MKGLFETRSIGGFLVIASLFCAGCRTTGTVVSQHSPSAPHDSATAMSPVVPPETTAEAAIAPVAFVDDGSLAAGQAKGTLSDQAPLPGPQTQAAPMPAPADCLHCQPGAPSYPAVSPSAILDAASRGVYLPPWRPPGIAGPWPRDEYLCDGGDQSPPAGVTRDDRAVGLESEDTIVQYETRDGKPRTQASNQVCIYAPRFAAVRKIYGMNQLDQRTATAGIDQPLALNRIEDVAASNTYVQPLQPGRYLGTKNASRLLAQNRGTPIDNVEAVAGAQNSWLPYEDLTAIRRGIMDNSEKARLTNRIRAAQTWSSPQAVQVVIDGILAAEASGQSQAEEVLRYELPDGKRRLRVIKIASAQDASPGDEIAFTLRVDNVGDLPVSKATILDQLTTRLELVDGSTQCSAEHQFQATPNGKGSATLRWDITDTIPVGEGIIIRFRCRVR